MKNLGGFMKYIQTHPRKLNTDNKDTVNIYFVEKQKIQPRHKRRLKFLLNAKSVFTLHFLAQAD